MELCHSDTDKELLDLSRNQLMGTISNEFDSKLKALSLMQNEITGTFPTFANSSGLRRLWLSETLIRGTIPSSWQNLTQLEILDLYNLESSGNFSTLLPMTNLKHLEIGGETDITGEWGVFPEAIGTLSLLEFLLVRYALSPGTIPTGFGLLTNLSESTI
jgi:hypothetical protein